MAKFLKSIFQTEKKSSRCDGEPEEVEVAPIDERKKLSMSRSGRLKHSYKKRHSLSLDLYGNEEMQPAERPKSKEYHVHTPVHISTNHITTESNQRKLSTPSRSKTEKHDGSKSPDEEIDSAFEIIDKS